MMILTNDLFQGNFKILIGLGLSSSGFTNSFEIIDLELSASKCQSPGNINKNFTVYKTTYFDTDTVAWIISTFILHHTY